MLRERHDCIGLLLLLLINYLIDSVRCSRFLQIFLGEDNQRIIKLLLCNGSSTDDES